MVSANRPRFDCPLRSIQKSEKIDVRNLKIQRWNDGIGTQFESVTRLFRLKLYPRFLHDVDIIRCHQQYASKQGIQREVHKSSFP